MLLFNGLHDWKLFRAELSALETKPLLCTDILNLTLYLNSNENVRDSNRWLSYFARSWSRAAEAYHQPS